MHIPSPIETTAADSFDRLIETLAADNPIFLAHVRQLDTLFAAIDPHYSPLRLSKMKDALDTERDGSPDPSDAREGPNETEGR
jgi:hypothetical protein